MLCLQSIATPALAFILLDPFSLCPDYTPVLRKTELELFAVEDTGAVLLCAVRGEKSGGSQHSQLEMSCGHQSRDQ